MIYSAAFSMKPEDKVTQRIEAEVLGISPAKLRMSIMDENPGLFSWGTEQEAVANRNILEATWGLGFSKKGKESQGDCAMGGLIGF